MLTLTFLFNKYQLEISVLLSCPTVIVSVGQRWWRQTHSAIYLNGWVWVQPFPPPLVSLAVWTQYYFSASICAVLLFCDTNLFLIFVCTVGRKEYRSSRAKRTLWRCWGSCGRRRTNLKSLRRDFLLTPCWHWSGGFSDPKIQDQSSETATYATVMDKVWMGDDSKTQVDI